MAAKQFASNIQNDKTILRSNKVIKFGSATINDFSFATTPDEVQSLPAWEEGMVPSQFPVTKIGPDGKQQTVYVASADNTNSALFALSGEIVEQEQEGIKFYDPLIIYKKGAKALNKTSYFIYTSLQDDNQNFPLSNESYWERYNQPASETLSGMVIKANQFDMQLGIDNEKYITPALYKANNFNIPKVTRFDVPNTFSFQCQPETKYAKLTIKAGGGGTSAYSNATGYSYGFPGENSSIQCPGSGGGIYIVCYGGHRDSTGTKQGTPTPGRGGGISFPSVPYPPSIAILEDNPGLSGGYDGLGGGNAQPSGDPPAPSHPHYGFRGTGGSGGKRDNIQIYGAGEGAKYVILVTGSDLLRQTWTLIVGRGGRAGIPADASIIGAFGGDGYAIIEEY